jgi:hypothetical protein
MRLIFVISTEVFLSKLILNIIDLFMIQKVINFFFTIQTFEHLVFNSFRNFFMNDEIE